MVQLDPYPVDEFIVARMHNQSSLPGLARLSNQLLHLIRLDVLLSPGIRATTPLLPGVELPLLGSLLLHCILFAR